MKIIISQTDLYPALQSVSRSCALHSSLPVLSNILFKTVNGKLELSATNLEIGVIKQIKAQVVEEGEITIPARTFLDITSSLAGSQIEIESQENQIQISTQKFKGLINTISASEFPTIPTAAQSPIYLNANLIEQTLPEISFAAAADEGRPILTGILTEIKNNNFQLIATDGFRLAHKTINLSDKITDSFRALIPKKSFEEVAKLITEELSEDKSEKESKIEIALSENQIVFKVGTTLISSRLIEGNYPAWEKTIPTGNPFMNRTVIERLALLKAVRLASIFAKDVANIVKFIVGPNSLKLTSETKELGAQETELDAQIEGSEITIAFNSKFLIDVLSSCSSSQISIEFSGNLLPILIKPLGDDLLEYVIMPVRLS